MLNIKIEMLKRNISIEALAEAIGTHRNSASAKINGTRKFTVEEAFTAKETFFPDLGLKYLFSQTSNTQK